MAGHHGVPAVSLLTSIDGSVFTIRPDGPSARENRATAALARTAWPGPTNARVLAAALAALPAATRRSLTSSLPALRELTGAVDALADDVQPDARQMADETKS